MSDSDTPAASETPAPATARRRRFGARGWSILILCVTLLLGAMAGLAVRYGINTGPGLSLLETLSDGLKLGRFGRLKLEGVRGDIWRDVTVDRLTVQDEKGVWLEAQNLGLVWNAGELFGRRFHAERVTARQVTVYRRPVLSEPTGKSGKMPISVTLDEIGLRLETLPAFSGERGLFDVGGNLAVPRSGGANGRIIASSRLHTGDFADVLFNLGQGDAIKLKAEAREAKGGALAGAIGLPAGEPFALTATADGTMKAGRFNLLTTVGDKTPAKAQGQWQPGGGEAFGHVVLTASTLTQPYVKMLGPEASFVLAGRKANTGFFALNGWVQTENLRLAANGFADIGKQTIGPDGLFLVATTPSLGRLSGDAVAGGARLDGVLRGDKIKWALTGTVAVTQFAAQGYTLPSLKGGYSVSMKDKDLGVTANLAGAGGAGSGYLGALLGSAPTANVDAARLGDGRLLLRRVRATGAGLKVDATGERGLLGGLNFKGTAQFSNLAMARPGAKGLLDGSWSASQSGPGKAWNFGLDVKGQGLALGYSELDRLLGATPKLKARASLLNGAIAVSEARLDAVAASVRTKGQLAKNGGLNFNLDWDAEGPFHAGPVEISGKAKGDGDISGTIKAPKATLRADIDAIDLPRLPLTAAHIDLTFMGGAQAADGTFAMTANSGYGPARLATAFRFAPGGVDLSGLDADAGGIQAKGAVSLRKGVPSTADLVLNAGPGILLTAGQVQGTAKVTDAPGGPRAILNLTAVKAVFRDAGGLSLADAAITANGPLDRLPLTIQARGVASPGRFNVNATGLLARNGDAWTLGLDGSGQLANTSFKTTETNIIGFGGDATTAKLRLASGEGRATVDARLTKAGVDVQADLAGVSLTMANEDLTGAFDAKLWLKGEGERLTGQVDANLRGARAKGAPRNQAIDGVVKAMLNDSSITIDASATNAQGLKATTNLVLPAESSASPLRLAINTKAPMRGRFEADGEIGPLWDLFAGGERSLKGHIVAQGTLGGSLSDPRINGKADLDNGGFEDGSTGLKLSQVQIATTFSDNAINVSSATAADGKGGSLSGAGRISLLRNGASSFKLDFKSFQVISNDLATAVASGTLSADRGADGNVKLAGELTIDKAEIAANPPTPSGVTPMEVVEINRPDDGGVVGPAAAKKKSGAGPQIILDINMKARRGIMVSGRGLNAEFSLNAHVGGTISKPDLTGTARVVRGDFDFGGQRFQFDPSGVIYLSTSPSQIRLDLTATREDTTLTASVNVSGTAAKPKITLTSSPQLPQDEILSRVLFGSSASQLSPLEAAQLASALASLAGGGGFDLFGNIRELAGLDRLSFAGGGNGETTVAGGKYITDKIYLEIIGGGREGAAAQLEWRVKRNVSVISRISGQGDSKLQVRWKRSY